MYLRRRPTRSTRTYTLFPSSTLVRSMLGSLGFRPGAFRPKASKLNPAAGLKRMFGMEGLIELVKSIAKVSLLGAIGVWMIWDRLTEIVGLGKSGLATAMAHLGNMFIMTCLVMAGEIGRASCRERVGQSV